MYLRALVCVQTEGSEALAVSAVHGLYKEQLQHLREQLEGVVVLFVWCDVAQLFTVRSVSQLCYVSAYEVYCVLSSVG